MKLSVSLPEQDVEFVDRYIAEHGEASRSAVLRKALERLRDEELVEAYKIAWKEWEASGDAALWDVTVGDGLEPEDWSAEWAAEPARED
ncbi:MAG: ribbon-helix-helix protein, CopG family [Chloroflexi bacterium]|nr:ribbon-helix-helix protein, CopG family [Chloroflexota bacterium]